MINKADRWQSPNTDGNWTLSRDYLEADKAEFKNTSFLTYLHRPEGYSIDYTEFSQRQMPDIIGFIGTNLGSYMRHTYFTSDSWMYLEAGSDNKVSMKEKIGQTCTPNNCSKFFWTKETVLSDKDYFTLKAYDVKH